MTKGGGESDKSKAVEEKIRAALAAGAASAATALPAGPEAAATAGALATLGHGVYDYFSSLSSGTRRLQEMAEAEDLRELGPEIAKRAQELVDDGVADEGDALGATAAVLNAWQRARGRCAAGHHSRLIAAAALHHFDPEAYKEGMALIVLEVLEGLDYPDIRELRRWAGHAPGSGPSRHQMKSGSLEYFHAHRLYERGLLQLNGMRVNGITELGLKVLEYVQSELADLGATEDS